MRLIDVIFSILALLLFTPVFCMIIPVLRFTGEGEVFYLQDRVGLFGNKFRVVKFATMLKNSPNIGSGTITSKNDNRILPVGRFLRKTKINELPQLINVLIGDMSLIGPRPHAQRDLHGIVSKDLEKIISIRPGLSGISSIVFRNEEDILSNFENPRGFYDSVIAPYKAQLEVWYFENKTFFSYFTLIFLTVFVVLTGRNKVVYSLFRTVPPIPPKLDLYL